MTWQGIDHSRLPRTFRPVKPAPSIASSAGRDPPSHHASMCSGPSPATCSTSVSSANTASRGAPTSRRTSTVRSVTGSAEGDGDDTGGGPDVGPAGVEGGSGEPGDGADPEPGGGHPVRGIERVEGPVV